MTCVAVSSSRRRRGGWEARGPGERPARQSPSREGLLTHATRGPRQAPSSRQARPGGPRQSQPPPRPQIPLPARCQSPRPSGLPKDSPAACLSQIRFWVVTAPVRLPVNRQAGQTSLAVPPSAGLSVGLPRPPKSVCLPSHWSGWTPMCLLTGCQSVLPSVCPPSTLLSISLSPLVIPLPFTHVSPFRKPGSLVARSHHSGWTGRQPEPPHRPRPAPPSRPGTSLPLSAHPPLSSPRVLRI